MESSITWATLALALCCSAPALPAIVLYDQFNSSADPNESVNSQDFEPAMDGYDNEAADDFVVPSGQTWSITEVDVAGEYLLAGVAQSFHVFILADQGGKPGLVVAKRFGQSFTAMTGANIALGPPVMLRPGSYWLVVQARLNYGDSSAKAWYWRNRTVQSGHAALWQNPGDALGTGCTTWGERIACVPQHVGPDQVFRLVGTKIDAIFGEGFETGTSCAWDSKTGGYMVGYYNSPQAVVPAFSETGNHTDDGSTEIALPFAYRLYDGVFTRAKVGSNGHLTFGTATDSANVPCMPVPGVTYAVGAFWTDQCTGPCTGVLCTGCGIFTSTTGSFPERVFNIEYRTRFYNSGGDGVPLDYEVRLFEGQRRLEIGFGTVNSFSPPSSRNLSIGLQGASTEESDVIDCDPTGGAGTVVQAGQVHLFGACSLP